jgi:hypothetical protein
MTNAGEVDAFDDGNMYGHGHNQHDEDGVQRKQEITGLHRCIVIRERGGGRSRGWGGCGVLVMAQCAAWSSPRDMTPVDLMGLTSTKRMPYL